MGDFLISYKKAMKIEGGYANDPDDSGGMTWRGISRKNHPDWKGWTTVDQIKLGLPQARFEVLLGQSTILKGEVESFYKKQFWDVMKLDQVVSQAICDEMFDSGINLNHEVVIEFLQMALNATNRNGRDYPDIDEDGKMGPKTVAVLNAHPRPAQVLKLLNCQQGVYYMNITRKRPSQEKFMTSWLSRVEI
jgi:lysozyme family protein